VTDDRELAGPGPGNGSAESGTSAARSASAGSDAALAALLDRLPEAPLAPVFTHSSWTAQRSRSYERLAFLGDSVLGLAVTTHLFPRLDADRFGPGRLTKIRAQAVSGRSCRAVAERLGVPDRLRAAAPPSVAPGVDALIGTERILASVIEAVIGACYLHFGYERTAEAVVEAFLPEIESAIAHSVDYKSALQERLARRGELVSYAVVEEAGPPHDRTFTVSAATAVEQIGVGVGRSKKDAEQKAAQAALESMRP
jgi:ribonuclease-3